MESQGSVGRKGSIPYFNEVAESYFARYLEQSPGGHAFRARKLRVLELLNGTTGKVLDVGCGPGVLVQDLLNLGCEVWAVDAAPQMIEECSKRFGHLPQVHCFVRNATALDFPDELFDAVICTGVIDRIQDHENAVKEMNRVLKPGGVLIISFPNLLSPYAAWKNFVFYPVVSIFRPIYYALARRPRSPSLYGFAWHRQFRSLLLLFAGLRTVHTVVTRLARHDAKVTDVAYYYFNIFLSPLDEVFSRWAVRVTERLECLRGGKLRWLGAGFVVRAVKTDKGGSHVSRGQ